MSSHTLTKYKLMVSEDTDHGKGFSIVIARFLNEVPFSQTTKKLLVYSQNDNNYDGKIVPAVKQTDLIENDLKA